MRFSQYLIPTFRETPSDAEVPSQQFALRGGYIKKVSVGIYDLLPLGLRVIRKVENIIRDEMNKVGAHEVLMPNVVPAELWQKSGRWYRYGKELLRIKDRSDHEYCFGPTHEEVIVDLVTNNVKSYKQLPMNLYQIQSKFRDEIRPRFGLMRAREFTMKDAYSFHASEENLDQTYQSMYQAYTRIFKRCGLKFRVVSADSGAIGGNASQEFMITADTGEDAILYCDGCHYAANVEKATTRLDHSGSEEPLPLAQVATPNQRTIEEVSSFLKVSPDKLIKTLVYSYIPSDDIKGEAFSYAVVCLRGDYELNEVKLGNVLDARILLLATDRDIEDILKAPVGFLGPIDLPPHIQLLVDDSVVTLRNGVTGASKIDTHYTGVNAGRDFPIDHVVDVKTVRSGDACPECAHGKLIEERGIEVGHIFKLGTQYSEMMQATFLDEQGKMRPFIMGCYGIGVGRTAMSAIEQSHDDKGPIWPIQLAPFEVIVIIAKAEDPKQKLAGETLYQKLLAAGIDVLYDDRNERIGVKFNDADLVGSPLRVVVGNKLAQDQVEFNFRSGEKRDVALSSVYDEVVSTIRSMR
jgi:prolyl-tRNA synthetase